MISTETAAAGTGAAPAGAPPTGAAQTGAPPTGAAPAGTAPHNVRGPVGWGVVLGGIQATAPLGFFWLEPETVYAVSLAFIAAVYVGFAVVDGRPNVLAVEVVVASAFLIVAAAAAMPGGAWLAVAGLAAHGGKDLWQHRTRFVANTRWWPPFCATVDWVAAGLLAVALTVGSSFPS